MQIVGVENWSIENFQLSFSPSKKIDISLKLAVGIIIYATIYFLQIIYNFTIHERYIKNSIQQFIDICSLANISIFIYQNNSYGYYIHGRSPHGFSDTDMCSMMLQFQREEENMCGHRGLMSGSEQQTYSFLAPGNLRIFYDKLIATLQKPNNCGPQKHYDKNVNSNFEKTLLAYHNINRFFGAFIDHALKDLDYIIRERNIVENLLDCEFENSFSESMNFEIITYLTY